MGIKVQPFQIDVVAALDRIGNDFKFDHAKGLAECLKNSCDAYRREGVPDREQTVIIRLGEDGRQNIERLECIDFVGMTKRQIDDAFKRFFDPQAAKKGSKVENVRTFGGHGNGGKFYMRQMFRTSKAVTYRNGKLNIFGFNAKRQYGFEQGFEDRPTSLEEALKIAMLEETKLPESIRQSLKKGETGFSVIIGLQPRKVKGTTTRSGLVERLALYPQARRLIDRIPIFLLFGSDPQPIRMSVPKLLPKEGFEDSITVPIPEIITVDGHTVALKSKAYSWPGQLILKTSADPLRGSQAQLNAIDFIGEIGVIGTYRLNELGSTRFSSQSEFIYGECECPILEDPDFDCVRNDRQKLQENERTEALIGWVRDQIESLAERMETKQVQEKKRQDLKNTSQLNEILNKWKNRFMGQVWGEMFAGKGPAGTSGTGPGSGGGAGQGGGGGSGGGSTREGGSGGGAEGGSETVRKPRFPQVLISDRDIDPLNPLSSEPLHLDPRQPAVYQRPKDVEHGIYWINVSRPLADKVIKEYKADSTRWREYLFQRYVDIITKEAIFQMGKLEATLTADSVTTKMEEIITKVHDQAAEDLDSFLFEEQFGA